MAKSNEVTVNETTSEEQEARAKLRVSFLRAINELNGEKCSILTYEKSQLQATFAGWNVEGDEVLVRDLKTPSVLHMDSAILRTPDIIAIQFDRPIELP